MAMHLDHIAIHSPNLYYGAHRLRLETGIGFYDGGFFSFGGANKIFPLGSQTYLELGGITDVSTVREVKNRPWMYNRIAALGECFTGLCFRVDTMEELEEIAKRKNTVINKNPTTRIRPDGSQVRAFSTPSAYDVWSQGLCNWYYFPDFWKHPSGQPVFTWPNLVRPTGVSFLEVGGTPQEMTDWLGVPESSFPFRFRYNERKAGLYAVGVSSPRGELTIRRPSATEF